MKLEITKLSTNHCCFQLGEDEIFYDYEGILKLIEQKFPDLHMRIYINSRYGASIDVNRPYENNYKFTASLKDILKKSAPEILSEIEFAISCISQWHNSIKEREKVFINKIISDY